MPTSNPGYRLQFSKTHALVYLLQTGAFVGSFHRP